MTPCEEKGYKVGDKFEVIEEDSFTTGSIVELYEDDGTEEPLFKLIAGYTEFENCNDEPGAYENLYNIKLLTKGNKMATKLEKLEEEYKQLQQQCEILGGTIKELQEKESKKIDWSKIPVDTLVETKGGLRYFNGIDEHEFGKFACHSGGMTSKTDPFNGKGDHWKSIKIVENPPQPWFGGECPISDNVNVKIWFRDGDRGDTVYPNDLRWSHIGSSVDIIAWQILGNNEWYT